MKPATISYHVPGILEHLFSHWERRRKADDVSDDGSGGEPPARRPVTVALSREVEAHGTEVARSVGAALGWPVYDHELLERIAADLGVHTALLEKIDERRVSWLHEAFEDLMSTPYVSEGAYFHRLVRTVLAVGAHGECVIVGRGAAHILPAATTLRVRLIAPLADRVAELSRRLAIPADEATRRIRRLDREQHTFVKTHFARDPGNPNNYDLVLCYSRLGVDGCVRLIVDAVHRLQASLREAEPARAAAV